MTKTMLRITMGIILMTLLVFNVSCGPQSAGQTSGGANQTGNAEKPKLICGVTEFEPINFRDASGAWTGFDTEFALLVGERLGMDVVFQEIVWDKKFMEIEAGAISCIWNGFTANVIDSVTGRPRIEDVDMSYGYMLNQQCVVIKADRAAEFKSIDALAGKTAAAEKGSAGESLALEAVGSTGNIIDTAAQINTFTEVKAGAVDCAVVDILLAQNITGSGDYSDLIIADITLDSEIYAVGFKKGSELTEKVNQAMKALYDEGKLLQLAEKYGLENTLILITDPGK